MKATQKGRKHAGTHNWQEAHMMVQPSIAKKDYVFRFKVSATVIEIAMTVLMNLLNFARPPTKKKL